ncbi:beclin 1-associated autophagy-related key regulator [Aplysia californica]|uniref:Beclin 1-associated autophagy-related key regulator n=1 Tax=Aplysia californica TaxID=6500 RepID=A0ABM0JPP1_APLCA|nr:beclin 1-associated autophagy-related key regulator [Aplysia californica]
MFPTNHMAIPQSTIVNRKFVMAASISQTRYDYKIAFQAAIKEGKIVPVAFEKCPLCCENRGFLLCDVCVNKGLFNHTQRRDSGRFCDKRQQLFDKRRERRELVKKFESHVEGLCRVNAKRTEIESAKKNIVLLKKAIADTKSKCITERIVVSQNKKRRRNLRAKLDLDQQETLPNLKLRITNLSDPDTQSLPTVLDVLRVRFDRDLNVQQLIALAATNIPRQRRPSGQLQEGTSIDPKSVPVLWQELQLYNQYLATQRRAFIQCMSQRIFPIKEIFVPSSSNLEMSMATALKDASETAFIAGRWVHVDLRGENHCMVIQSTLPEYSGDSSALGLFVMTNRYASENPDKVPVGNPSYGIQSALGYTNMFVSLAANICDVHLPRKCSFRELRNDISEYDFCNFVWRLHQNIRHWAASQKVECAQMVDYLSLRNLLAILESSGLGRVGAFEAQYRMPVKAELCPLEYESDEEELDASGPDMDVSRDWERVPSGLPSYEAANMGVSAPVDTSTTGAFLNAAASLTGWFKSYYNK